MKVPNCLLTAQTSEMSTSRTETTSVQTFVIYILRATKINDRNHNGHRMINNIIMMMSSVISDGWEASAVIFVELSEECTIV